MDIDLAALRALERERDISLDVLIPAIEQALAARLPPHRRHLPQRARRAGPQDRARRRLGREDHEVPPPRARSTTRATPRGHTARPVPSSTTPRPASAGSPRATARQVIVQRLRDLEDDAILGDFKGREGDVVAGIIQQSPDPRHVTVDFGAVEGILPLAEQVPGESYVHGERLRCFVVSVKRGPAGPQIGLSRTHPNLVAQAVRARGARDRRRHASRSRRWPARPVTAPRSRCTPRSPGLNAKGACIGPMGARVRAVMTELHGEKIDIVD